VTPPRPLPDADMCLANCPCEGIERSMEIKRPSFRIALEKERGPDVGQLKFGAYSACACLPANLRRDHGGHMDNPMNSSTTVASQAISVLSGFLLLPKPISSMWQNQE